ncbi:MAG: GNAT family N-acetyltransferase [Candidatus Thorarchaeota archaeon]|nr:GNAT family N-acetyltransferase [Candidatus Thorarchaeota archaeon]
MPVVIMLREISLERWNSIRHLFDSHTMLRAVIRQCAQLGIGTLEVDDSKSPSVALYSIPMMSFLAGDSTRDSAISLVESVPPLSITVAPDSGWSVLIQDLWGQKARVQHRTRLDPTRLDVEHIRALKKELPEGYELHELDLDSARQITHEYKKQIEVYFRSVEGLLEKGIGYCVKREGKLASLAYTPFPFIDEFEIQVFTENSLEHRRKGLATAVCAALIEHGLENGLVPHWDAANPPSVGLALKLGYTNPIPYDVYYYLPEMKE